MNRWRCGQQSGRKRRLLCNGADTGCVSCRPHHRTRKRAHFPEALHARERGKSAHEAKQTATWKTVGMIVWQGGTHQTVRPITRSLRGWSGEATDRSKPSDNVPTLERVAPEPRGDGVSASIRRRRG